MKNAIMGILSKRYPLTSGSPPKSLSASTENSPLGEYVHISNAIKKFFPKNASMRRIGVDDDGSCYYHSLAAILNFENWHHTPLEKRIDLGHQLRLMLRGGVTKRTWLNYWNGKGVSTSRVPNMSRVVEQMSSYTTWADVYAIMFTQHILGTNLIVIDLSLGEIYCGTHNPQKMNQTMIICWINHSHFEPIVQLTPDGVIGKFSKNDPVLKFLLERYNEQGCPRYSLHDILKRKRKKSRE
jgi:hypothetical protein